MKRIFIVAMMAVAMVAAVVLQSCTEEKYTVWTYTESYAAWEEASQLTITDGYYKRLELTNDEWKQIGRKLPSEGKHRWSEEEIYKWFIGCGFGTTEARRETSWLVTVNHGYLVMRDGYLVYEICK